MSELAGNADYSSAALISVGIARKARHNANIHYDL